ncbi:Ribosome biogenesis protein Kri1, partial [Tieghemiomyces parasiticus]
MPPYGNHGRRFGSGANAGRTNQHWNNQPAEQEASFANAVPLGDPNQTLDNAHGDDSISHGLDSLSSSSEEEDETGDLMTPDVDLQIFKAIGAIRNKDQRLYDDKSNFFSAEELRKSRQEWEAKLKA